MKSRKETTIILSEMLKKYLNPNNDPRIYIAREVTFDYGKIGQCRVDYMQFNPLNNSVSGIEKGDVYCYEIKSCPEDFASIHGHNLLGDYNYYVMPKDTYETVRSKLEYNAGVLCPNGDCLEIVRKARRCDRKKPLTEVLLMMFRSVNRDLNKKKEEQ